MIYILAGKHQACFREGCVPREELHGPYANSCEASLLTSTLLLTSQSGFKHIAKNIQ